MVSESRKQSMAWIETDYSKHTHFRWKIKWRLDYLGALGIMSETAPSTTLLTSQAVNHGLPKVLVNYSRYQKIKRTITVHEDNQHVSENRR